MAKGTSSVSGVEKKRDGRPPFQPTAKDRKLVDRFAGLLKHEALCMLVDNPTTGEPINPDTLRRHFARELARGKPDKDAKVARSLVDKALGDGPQAVTAALWYTKTQMGWRERIEVQAEIKTGVLIAPAGQTSNEWIRAEALRTAMAAADDAPQNGNGKP